MYVPCGQWVRMFTYVPRGENVNFIIYVPRGQRWKIISSEMVPILSGSMCYTSGTIFKRNMDFRSYHVCPLWSVSQIVHICPPCWKWWFHRLSSTWTVFKISQWWEVSLQFGQGAIVRNVPKMSAMLVPGLKSKILRLPPPPPPHKRGCILCAPVARLLHHIQVAQFLTFTFVCKTSRPTIQFLPFLINHFRLTIRWGTNHVFTVTYCCESLSHTFGFPTRYQHFRFALNFTTKSDHSDKLHLGASPTLPLKSDIQIPTFQVCT
jgi:hypothetical protein